MPGKQTSLCTPNHPAPNPGPRMIPCALWRTLPHFTALHLMENNAIVAFPHTLRRHLSYYILKAFKNVMHRSLWLLSEEKCWGEFMQLIKIFFPAIRAVSCSCTSKWFSHKKLRDEASLYNTDSDTGKLHDLRKHSLVYQLKYAMTIVLQSFQWPTLNWNIHCQKTLNQPEKSTSLWASLSSVWERFSCRSASEQLQAQKVQAVRTCKRKIPSSLQNMP